MTTGYTIRNAAAADLPRLAEIERDAAQLFRSIGYDFCADGPVRDEDEKTRALEDGAVFVAEAADGDIAGFALLWRIDGRAHLLELGVAQRHQKQGLGASLVAQAEAWARQEGFGELTLTTFRDVAWNAPFYERLGFLVFDPEPERAGLRAVQDEEQRSGFAKQPRVAMRKRIV